MVWQLTTPGRRLLAVHRPHQRTLNASHHRLLHSLAVAEVHLALRELHQPANTGGTTAIEAVAGSADGSVEVQVEPDSWRTYTGLGGEQRILKPDLAADIHGHDEDGTYTDRWLIEVDLGTESLPTLLRKCEVYEAYRLSGKEQAATGTFPLVLWVLHTPERIEALRTAIGRRSSLTSELYRFALPESVSTALSSVQAEATSDLNNNTNSKGGST